MEEMGVQYEAGEDVVAVYNKFVGDVVHVVHVTDITAAPEGPYASDFIGVCSGGLCLWRLSAPVHVVLKKAKCGESFLDDQELHSILLRLLQAVIARGIPGLLSLTMLPMNPDAMSTLADMLRIRVEPDTGGGRSQETEFAVPKILPSLDLALDAVLTVLIAQDAPEAVRHSARHGEVKDFLEEVVRKRPLVALSAAPLPEAPKFSEDPLRDLAAELRSQFWAATGHPESESLDDTDLRNLLVRLFNRPLLSLLVRSRMTSDPEAVLDVGGEADEAASPDGVRKPARKAPLPIPEAGLGSPARPSQHTVEALKDAMTKQQDAKKNMVEEQEVDKVEETWLTLLLQGPLEPKEGDPPPHVSAAYFDTNIISALQAVVDTLVTGDVDTDAEGEEASSQNSEPGTAPGRTSRRGSIEGPGMAPHRAMCSMEWLKGWLGGGG